MSALRLLTAVIVLALGTQSGAKAQSATEAATGLSVSYLAIGAGLPRVRVVPDAKPLVTAAIPARAARPADRKPVRPVAKRDNVTPTKLIARAMDTGLNIANIDASYGD